MGEDKDHSSSGVKRVIVISVRRLLIKAPFNYGPPPETAKEHLAGGIFSQVDKCVVGVVGGKMWDKAGVSCCLEEVFFYIPELGNVFPIQ